MNNCQFKNTTFSLLLKSFCLIYLVGCAETPVAPVKKDDRLIVAQWNKLPLRFSDREIKDDAFVTNPFFDIDPKIENFKDKELDNFGIRYFVSTPVESKFQYNIDLYSGKLYRERAFCAQDDIWQNYSGDLLTPNFTQGFVPRVYDEAKQPQRLIVISDKEAIEPFKEQPQYFDIARVIGSVVVERCENFPCDQNEKWKASQILVGVSAREVKLNSLDTFVELKKKINWNYAKAMIVNMNGYHKLGGRTHAAFRISKELNLKDTYAYFSKNSKKISNEEFGELNTWRVGCMKLYDSIWDESEKIRKQDHGQAESFLKYFKEFYAKSSNEFYQCQKLVRPANIVENHRRLWFFSYIQAFNLLEKNGFYYSCVDNAWAYNPRVDTDKFYVDQNKELARCRAKNFEKAFDQAINGMSLMRNQTNRQFRFIEYDNMSGGSHQKLYSWIFDKNQNFACKYDSKTPNQIPFEVFPQDVVWENFKQDDAGVVR